MGGFAVYGHEKTAESKQQGALRQSVSVAFCWIELMLLISA